ncbi:MAG: PBP1A family penicillin-binding protein [Sulfurovaceae bacterium]|nr:PBP1A family penicillin-binding protein [Sulfurovaceae bacterium]
MKALKLFTKILILFLIGLVSAGIYAYVMISLDAKKLIDYHPELSTQIVDRNGNTVAYIYKDQNRLYAKYDEMPKKLIYSLVAIEDSGFFEHKGVSPEAILRAILKDIQAGSFVEGGSTLTQQLIKNTYLSNEKKLARKIKEAVLALKIEKALTKEQILEVYLNEIFFGNGYYGVKTAANGYFHKNLNELTLKESAMLAGIPNAPTSLNPIKYYDKAEKRANLVLGRLKSLGWIDEQQYNQAINEQPIVYKENPNKNLAPYVVDEVIKGYEPAIEDIKTGGYKIYTTIDIKLQEVAQEAALKTYDNAQRYTKNDSLNVAVVSMENETGNVLAMVGGIDYVKSPFNRAVNANRQPGSSFKPFVYQVALDNGYSPASVLDDSPKTFNIIDGSGRTKLWSPKNYDGTNKGHITLREALIHSRNLPIINLVDAMGLFNVADALDVLQINNMPRVMSLALGSLSATPLKMVQMYSIFPNGGKMVQPKLVTKIISRDGEVVFKSENEDIAEFTIPKQAYLMTTMLQDVVRRGTGTAANVGGIDLAGKTGTTNNNVDAWFCGYSPTTSTVIWVGRDDNKPMNHSITGGTTVASAFGLYYKKLISIYPKTKRHFDVPKGVEVGTIGGVSEYYTDISPFPENQDLLDANATDANATNDTGNNSAGNNDTGNADNRNRPPTVDEIFDSINNGE